jgi:hypothetical protein
LVFLLICYLLLTAALADAALAVQIALPLAFFLSHLFHDLAPYFWEAARRSNARP